MVILFSPAGSVIAAVSLKIKNMAVSLKIGAAERIPATMAQAAATEFPTADDASATVWADDAKMSPTTGTQLTAFFAAFTVKELTPDVPSLWKDITKTKAIPNNLRPRLNMYFIKLERLENMSSSNILLTISSPAAAVITGITTTLNMPDIADEKAIIVAERAAVEIALSEAALTAT